MEHLQQIGELNMRFDSYQNGIYYYQVALALGKERRKIQLPRYHRFLGWIEIFGLPPQHEWVVFTDIEAFEKRAELRVDEQLFQERCAYTPKKDKRQHEIVLERVDPHGEAETCIWTEDYTEAPEKVLNKTIFTHKDGCYTCTTTKSRINSSTLSGEDLLFSEHVFGERGETDVIWRKDFHAKGALPSIYYTLFPSVPGLDLTDAWGSVLEFGYPHIDKGEPIEQMHGDWYKKFAAGDATYYIIEDGFSSKRIESEEGEEVIKDTYRKRLFKDTI